MTREPNPAAIPMRTRRILACLVLALVLSGPALAEDRAKPKGSEGEIARYCANLAPTAAEARIAFQSRHLAELEERISKQIVDLEATEAAARDWVTRRETLMKAATDDVVAIYAKMSAEAAAAQIGAMDDAVAAGILSKLSPRVASAVLGEMEAEKAAKLTSLMAGTPVEDKKS